MNDKTERFAARWIVLALVYFVAAVMLGVGMAASHDFRLKGVHVHLNMLGWVSMALTGLIYRVFPQAASTRLARWHFALYQSALPVMMVALGGLLLGSESFEPLVAASSVAMLAAIVLFALAIWRRDESSVRHVHQPQAAA